MDRAKILLTLSVISFVSILFMPQGTLYWIYLLILGIIFGVAWWMNKRR